MFLLKALIQLSAILVFVGLGLFGVAALSGNEHRWIDILAQFTGPAFLAALAGVIVCLLLRWRLAMKVGFAVCLLLLAAVWPQWFPPMGKPQADQPIIRVYSANIYASNTDTEAMKQSIAAADADIIVLVEFGDAPAMMFEDIVAGYPHRVVNGRMGEISGSSRSVIASRYPIERKLKGKRDGLSAIGAAVETPLGLINVYGVHLTRPWPYQFQWGQISQVMALTERVKGHPDNPLIIAGDFNSVSDGRIGRQMKADLGVIPAPGLPGTWPTKLPALVGINIDQVYRSPDLALIDRKIGIKNGSDHYPVITEFTLAQP